MQDTNGQDGGQVGQAEAQRAAGSEASADARFDAYRAALRSFVARRVDDPAEVDDLVQEACTRLIASAREQALDVPQAYLFRIAANLIADRHRRAAPVHTLLDGQEVAVPAAQEDARRLADLRAALTAALDELSPRTREVFVLRRFDERGTGEIARALGISPRMVQKHLTSAMAHLYARLAHLMDRPL